MRNQKQIRADIAAAQAEYQKTAETRPAHEARPHAERVRALQAELSAALTPGAEPCEKCGAAPLGLRHVHARQSGRFDEQGRPMFYFSHRYEVGCVACGDKRAIATTPEELVGATLDEYADETIARAVKRWNDEQYLPPPGKAPAPAK